MNSPNIICVLSVLVHDDQILAAAPARLFCESGHVYTSLLTLFVFGNDDDDAYPWLMMMMMRLPRSLGRSTPFRLLLSAFGLGELRFLVFP